MELCIGIWKKWAQCPKELGPPPPLGKNKIINNENEGCGRKVSYNRNTLRTEEIEKFSERGLQVGLMNQAELPPREIEGAWDADVNLECFCAFLLRAVQRFVCLSKIWLSLFFGLEKSKLVSLMVFFFFLTAFRYKEKLLPLFICLGLFLFFAIFALHRRFPWQDFSVSSIVIKRFCWLF